MLTILCTINAIAIAFSLYLICDISYTLWKTR